MAKKRSRWGQLEVGNIDAYDRPMVKRPGGYSTTLSGSSEIDGKEVLLPHVGDLTEGTFGTEKSRNPTIITNKNAKMLYSKTGKHLGKFRDYRAADQYSKALHEMQVKDDARKGRK